MEAGARPGHASGVLGVWPSRHSCADVPSVMLLACMVYSCGKRACSPCWGWLRGGDSVVQVLPGAPSGWGGGTTNIHEQPLGQRARADQGAGGSWGPGFSRWTYGAGLGVGRPPEQSKWVRNADPESARLLTHRRCEIERCCFRSLPVWGHVLSSRGKPIRPPAPQVRSQPG